MAEGITRVGFVGLGRMGGSMAERLMQAGYAVHGTARAREHVQSLIDKGLGWRDSAREVAGAADVVVTSLPGDDSVLAVASGPDGLLAGLGDGKVWIDMSTVSPSLSDDLARRVHARAGAMLAAPVSGSVPQAQSGTLVIMVGGDGHASARVEPLLRELGTPSHVGDNGQALVLKLAINISLGVQALAFAEGLLLALRSGIDSDVALELMTNSAIGSPMLKARAPNMLNPPPEAWFDLGFMQKDIELALDTARKLHTPLPTAERTDEVLATGRELGYGRSDIAALFQVLQRMGTADGKAAA